MRSSPSKSRTPQKRPEKQAFRLDTEDDLAVRLLRASAEALPGVDEGAAAEAFMILLPFQLQLQLADIEANMEASHLGGKQGLGTASNGLI